MAVKRKAPKASPRRRPSIREYEALLEENERLLMDLSHYVMLAKAATLAVHSHQGKNVVRQTRTKRGRESLLLALTEYHSRRK